MQQLGADAARLEIALDAERRLRRARPDVVEYLELHHASEFAGDPAAERHRPEPVGARAIALDPFVGDHVAEPECALLRSEAQEVGGKRIGVLRPKLSEDPAGARTGLV